MEVKDITDRLDAAADLATGAVVAAINPSGEAARLERKGAPARRKLHNELRSTAADAQETVETIAGALLPERVVLRSLSLVKARARRVDLIGELAYRGLDVFHGSVKEIARAFDRIERASTPPARPKRSVSRRYAARTSVSVRRSSSTPPASVLCTSPGTSALSTTGTPPPAAKAPAASSSLRTAASSASGIP